MKFKKFEKRLILKKETIADLSKNQLNSLKGGTFPTAASCLQPPESRCVCQVSVNDEKTGCACNTADD
jgi:natural product precursor